MCTIVPRLLMKASPGPVVRKNPEARSHIVGSVRKRRVSVLRTRVFFRAEEEVGRSEGLLPWNEDVERAGGEMVP